VTKKDIYPMLGEEFDLEPVDSDYFGEVAQRDRCKDSGAEVGFITSVSESFCSTCTIARMSSDGNLFTCLFATEGLDSRELIRSGKSDEKIQSTITGVWAGRTDRYSDERTEETAKKRKKINMSYIGG